METLKYSLKKTALAGITNDVTEAQYRQHIARFSKWAKDTHRIRLASDVSNSCALAQEYADYLSSSGYAPDTIHSYLAPVVKGLGLSLDAIEKPKRKASAIKKTREENVNKQGLREMGDEKNKRLVDAALAIGIRRDELAALRGDCLVRDYAGHLCVLARSGKGGKTQLQRLFPQDESAISALFSGIAPRERVFSRAEMNNKIPIHALRRAHAQEAYNYYLQQIQSGHRQDLIDDLKQYFLTYHAKSPGEVGDRRLAKQYTRFCQDLNKGHGVYRLRGENLKRAQRAGRPIVYDRVALMAVSVYHLAHWRNDVTVRNYMV